MNWRRHLLTALALAAAAQALQAEIISDALLTFPALTESLEYDNLAALRALPNYDALRQRFAGKPLEDVKSALGELNIPEGQVSEIIMGSSPAAFFGLIAGTFSGQAAAKAALKKGLFPLKVDDASIYCPAGGTCLLFLDDSLAAFGTSGQLQIMLQARQGVVGRLGGNADLAGLINKTDRRAPVRGVASGSQLKAAMADALQDQSGLGIDWDRWSSNLSALGYSVSLDSKAHVSATLECKSAATAGLLRQMLGALGSLQSVAAQVGKDPASMPFQNMRVSSSGNVIDLKMDAPIPTA